MERVLELLATEHSDDFRTALQLLTPELLDTSPEQIKHKLKVRISALLKSTGRVRAYGAVLARHALIDWSVVKSHGSSWVMILLHVLDLPDHVCWRPATKTLTFLFSRVNGKPDLARDIAGSKIGDFMKRLITTLPSTNCYYAATEMLRLYPTQCRPHLNKLEPILNGKDALALASLCISEKQGAEVWTSRVSQCLTTVTQNAASLSERELEFNLNALVSYISFAPIVGAKVPAKQLNDLLVQLISLLKPVPVVAACEFICATFDALKPMYIQQFDNLVYRLGDCIDMGIHEAVKAFAVVQLLVTSTAWVSENYSRLFTRLIKKALATWEGRNKVIGAQGLADFVQTPAAFTSCVLDPAQSQGLLDFLITAVVNVPGIPQSVRGKVDKVIVAHGSADNIVKATLYPAKFSIMPLAVDRLPALPGLETLIHSRFPPLKTSKRLLEDEQDAQDEPEHLEQQGGLVTSAGLDSVNPPQTIDQTIFSAFIQPQEPNAVVNNAPLPKIPESNKPSDSSPVYAPPPEKRAKTEQLIVQQEQESTKPSESDHAGHEDDEEEELVIPTLSMDSD